MKRPPRELPRPFHHQSGSRPSADAKPTGALILDFSDRLQEINSCHLKPRGLQFGVTASQEAKGVGSEALSGSMTMWRTNDSQNWFALLGNLFCQHMLTYIQAQSQTS